MIANDIAGGDGPPKHVVDDPESDKGSQPVHADKDRDGDQEMSMQKPDVEEQPKNMNVEGMEKMKDL